MKDRKRQQTANPFSRRGFLTGKRLAAPLRPPWSVAAAAFAESCTRCDDCRDVCPEGIIVRGGGGFPEINFVFGECTFCGDCRDTCRGGAITPHDIAGKDDAPWSLKAEISDACLPLRGVECRICQDQCASLAIVFGFGHGGIQTPDITEEDCSGCGACFRVCPANAISLHASHVLHGGNGAAFPPRPVGATRPQAGEGERQ